MYFRAMSAGLLYIAEFTPIHNEFQVTVKNINSYVITKVHDKFHRYSSTIRRAAQKR